MAVDSKRANRVKGEVGIEDFAIERRCIDLECNVMYDVLLQMLSRASSSHSKKSKFCL
jgi:hypothetical protein